jgi:hypothetical protein
VSLFRQLGLKEAIRLLGVTLSGLVQAETPRQLELFEVRSQAGTGATRSEQLGQALDAINQKFGGTTVRRGAEGVGKVTHSDRIKVGALEEGAIVHQGTTDDDESVP